MSIFQDNTQPTSPRPPCSHHHLTKISSQETVQFGGPLTHQNQLMSPDLPHLTITSQLLFSLCTADKSSLEATEIVACSSLAPSNAVMVTVTYIGLQCVFVTPGLRYAQIFKLVSPLPIYAHHLHVHIPRSTHSSSRVPYTPPSPITPYTPPSPIPTHFPLPSLPTHLPLPSLPTHLPPHHSLLSTITCMLSLLN